MYLDYFQLREMPFSITPDPAYLYMSPRHQEALGHLLFGTGQYGGFVQLTGEVGTGKTTIVRTLLDQKLDDVDVAYIHNPRQSEQEFVQSICDELGVDYPREAPTLKTLVDTLNEHLLRVHAAGRRTVIIIDEAQNLTPAVLEQVRLLTNLETAKEKLLRIMLIGQPELSQLLARADMRQLASRVSARYHLTPLGGREIVEYIEHRLRIAGAKGEIFTPAAMEAVRRHSAGVPRLINIVCDRALLGAYARNARRVTPEIVSRAATEAIGEMPEVFDPRAKHRWRLIELGWGVALLLCVGLLYWSFFHHSGEPQASVPVAAAPPTAAAAVATVPETLAAPVVKPAPVVEQPTDIDADIKLLERSSEDLNDLMSRLAALWDPKAEIPSGEKVCSGLKRSKLECLRDKGNWSDLRQLNRPAVLRFDLPTLGKQYFLLTSLSDNDAGFETALGPVRISRASMERVWNGEFLILWRREIGEYRIDADTSGAPISWLWKRLAALEKIAMPPGPPTRFDDKLKAAVSVFQKKRGLPGSGIAGTKTLIMLADGLPNTPALQVVNP